jgi:hypothetical protein
MRGFFLVFNIFIFLIFVSCKENIRKLESSDELMKNFIGQVIKDKVPDNLKYFNLVDSSYIITVDSERLKAIREFKENPDFPLTFSAIEDSVIVNWCAYGIKRAKCKPYSEMPRNYGLATDMKTTLVDFTTPKKIVDSLNKLGHAHLYVPVQKYWSKQKIESVTKKAWEEFFTSITPEYSSYYSFSTPLFSSDKKYAIVGISTKGGGRKCIYKRNGQIWICIAQFGFYITN